MPKVNPEILIWARENAGLAVDEAVGKLGIRPARGVEAIDRLRALEDGSIEPTRPVLLKMAKQYRRPLITFYMEGPPKKGDRGQDFRTLPEGDFGQAEALLDALIRDVQARQSMVRSVLEAEDEAVALAFIGSMAVQNGVPEILASIQSNIGIATDVFREQSTDEEAFAYLRIAAESAGIFVLLASNLGSHHSTIDPEVFRGFAIADEIAPFIIINDQDSHAAWSFTLVHELAHLWLGETGVSGARAELAIEKFCNEVAGDFLLPNEELQFFKIPVELDLDLLMAEVSIFADERNLSSSMVAYRMYLANRIDQSTWRELGNRFRDLWLRNREDRKKKSRTSSGGPDYYTVRRHRIGPGLIRLVQRMMRGGSLSTTKAAKILGVKAKNVHTLFTSTPQS